MSAEQIQLLIDMLACEDERLARIVALTRACDEEQDADKRENIVRSIVEIVRNEPTPLL